MAHLIQVGVAKDAGDQGNEFRFAVFSRVAAMALLTPLVGYFLAQGENRVWDVIQEYRHSELLVFLVGCGFIVCVEAIAWFVRLAFTKGDLNRLTRRCG